MLFGLCPSSSGAVHVPLAIHHVLSHAIENHDSFLTILGEPVGHDEQLDSKLTYLNLPYHRQARRDEFLLVDRLYGLVV